MRTAQIYKEYAEYIVRVGDACRSEVAAAFGVHYNTAAYHLERACAEGLIEKYYAYLARNQSGWAYRPVGANEKLPFDDPVASEHAPTDNPVNTGLGGQCGHCKSWMTKTYQVPFSNEKYQVCGDCHNVELVSDEFASDEPDKGVVSGDACAYCDGQQTLLYFDEWSGSSYQICEDCSRVEFIRD